MSDTAVEWREVYEGKQVAFQGGRGIGDFYPVKGAPGIFRVRVWRPGRLEGGLQGLVTSEEAARALLVELREKAQREGEG